MDKNKRHWMVELFEGLPDGSVIMGDETYLKSHSDRIGGEDEHVFIPHYSLGAFSAEEVAEMLIDAGCGWKITTPDN